MSEYCSLILSAVICLTLAHEKLYAGKCPCDIYKDAGTPCVAAHSTVRLLSSTYTGPLYQVRRLPDSTTKDIYPVKGGTAADGAAQDSFCAGSLLCEITILYDQSGHGNDVKYQGHGGSLGKCIPSDATKESLMLGGKKVYSLWINSYLTNPGKSNSYWADGSKNGMATGKTFQSIYMVTSGTHVNGDCCFDYGNSETNRDWFSNGSMDAINFSKQCWQGQTCNGSGPWIQADLENGLYPRGRSGSASANTPLNFTYVSAMMKNKNTEMSLKGGNAQSGNLITEYAGGLPVGYDTMRRQGAIVLGSGGDCCYARENSGAGTFYEGAIIPYYVADSTEDSIQANIAAAGYGSTKPPVSTRYYAE